MFPESLRTFRPRRQAFRTRSGTFPLPGKTFPSAGQAFPLPAGTFPAAEKTFPRRKKTFRVRNISFAAPERTLAQRAAKFAECPCFLIAGHPGHDVIGEIANGMGILNAPEHGSEKSSGK